MSPASVRIVLVGTTHPGNIGAAARAMRTMGLGDLCLVAPARFPHAEATARASGADGVLAGAAVCATLDQALEGCHLVLGTSARTRYLQRSLLDPRAAAARVAALPGGGRAALVFGRERTGLTNDELDRCHHQVVIPSDPAFPALNLAAAVQVVAYELRVAAISAGERPPAAGPPPAPAEELARFYTHLERVLQAIGYLDPANPRHLMSRLRLLFHRACPDHNEVNILRGALAAVERRIGDRGARNGGDC